ncbi:MAG TPA: hypothetical protein VF629_22810 [Hymenobacter sp.]|uniref:hypothetical protein n=1 Tax=Hymenobacter sp. TaxID=1898978 RepID=UPI002ED973DF
MRKHSCCILEAERYHRAGKTLHLRHLSPDCRQLLSNAGALIGVNVEEDPRYTVAEEERVRTSAKKKVCGSAS